MGKLEGHHLTIWKAITKYSWVNIKDLESLLGRKNLYKKGRICHISEVRGKGIINKNRNGCGIPQGTPISGLYANISLLSFDKCLRNYCDSIGGIYMRYSDDIALIVPCNINPDDVVKYIEKTLKKERLSMSSHKTEISRFKEGKVMGSRPFQYLGFVYDGEKILIRSSTISTYLRKMRRGIREKLLAAKKAGVNPNSVYKRELYSRYTHLGKRRNFITYAMIASRKMKSDHIRKQIKRHVTWFKRAFSREVKRIFGE